MQFRIPCFLFLCIPLLSAPRDIAMEHVQAKAAELGLGAADIASVYIAREYRSEHNGVTHVTFRQRIDGLDVTNAVYVVNVSEAGEVINEGGKLLALPQTGDADTSAAGPALETAVREVNPKLAEGFVAAQTIPFGTKEKLRFAKGQFADDITGRFTWFGTERGVFPAWSFEITDPATGRTWEIIVESGTERVLAKRAMTLLQSATGPRGLVFEKGSPQPNPNPGSVLTATPPLVNRTLQSFTGDPAASPKGWVANNQTAGNNVVAGANPLGRECLSGIEVCQTRPEPVAGMNGDFSFPLELGPNAANPATFAAAATTNLFYWINRAHDFFYKIGFDEAAGNFQEENFGKGGIGGDAVYAYAQAGTRAPTEASTDNANFGGVRINDDGSRPRIAMYLWTLGGIWLDGSLDADVILHEYTHGVTHRLTPDLYASQQGGAMGEGWSDFFALEILTPEGAPVDGVYPAAAYPLQNYSAGLRSRPYTTSMEVNPLTFADYGRVISRPEEHADGEIWTQALWEVRAALIRQFGETEGRRRTRQILIDGLKLSVPAPSMIDARDAILLADRTTFRGASQDQIWAAFARRGLGVLAQSYNANSVHISPSFERPSRTGALRFYNENYTIGETIDVVLHDGNQTADRVQIQLTGSSGDLENLVLRKRGPVYTGRINTRYAPVFRGNGTMDLIPADAISAYYTDHDTGAAPKQTTLTVETTPDYGMFITEPRFEFQHEQAIGLRTGFGRVIRVLPFEFPFFGKTYKSVYVYNNGILTFDLPDFSPCSDILSLGLLKAIAPMWMSLRTDGRAQPGEDVYVSETEETVTFRWAAETGRDVSIPGVTSGPDPVNFATRLHRDGTIEFFYGTGNKNLVSGSQIFGCPAAAPTAGISNGHESFVQLAITHDSQGNLENAPTVVFEPPFPHRGRPVVTIESPKAGDTVNGVILGSGIVYEPEEDLGIRRLDVIVDGIARTTARTGVARRDYCAENPVSGCPLVGYTFTIDPERFGLAPGVHKLLLRATNTRGVTIEYPEQPLEFVVAGVKTTIYGNVEAPEPDAEVSGRMTITGHVALSDARVSGVEAIIDGINYGPGGYGQTRQDVCAQLPQNTPGCPRIGFTISLSTDRQNPGTLLLPSGPHTLQIRARDEFGRYHTFPEAPIRFIVNNEANQPPRVVLTTPLPNERVSGMIHVSGYAWDPDGKIESVRLFVDDILFSVTAPIEYGVERTEICATLPDVEACPNIGFGGEFDTKRLANGLHTLRVIVVDDGGRTAEAPNVSVGGINIFVQNP